MTRFNFCWKWQIQPNDFSAIQHTVLAKPWELLNGATNCLAANSGVRFTLSNWTSQSPPLTFFLCFFVVECNRMWKVEFLWNETKSRNALLSSTAVGCLVNGRASRDPTHSNCPWNTCKVRIRTQVPTVLPLQILANVDRTAVKSHRHSHLECSSAYFSRKDP